MALKCSGEAENSELVNEESISSVSTKVRAAVKVRAGLGIWRCLMLFYCSFLCMYVCMVNIKDQII